MPFTLSHAAAVYPLRRTPFVLSALIFGTFAPDLEYFLRFAPKGPYGHTTPGLFFFCLPVGFGCFWIFHDLVKEPLAALMPRAVREKIVPGIYPMSLRYPLHTLLILVSILVGAVTHLLWDSFTHAQYWPGHHLPVLGDVFTLPLVGEVHLYKLLQYASTVFGLVVVFFWSRNWLRIAPIQPNPAGSSVPPALIPRARILIPAVSLLGALIRTLIGVHSPTSPRGLEIWIGEFVVTSISLAWLELMTWGLFLPIRAAADLPPLPSAR